MVAATVLLTLLTLFGSQTLLGQSDTMPQPEVLAIEEVVVSATRLPATAEVAPVSSVLLDRETFDRYSPRSMAEALIGVPAVWMQKTNHGGGSPFIRGLTGNQVLLLYDGIRLNNSTYRYGPNQYFNTIDPFTVDRVEVVPGGGSVLYGSDALGGTINVLTREPTYADTGAAVFSGRLLGRLRSSGMESTLRSEVDLRGQRLAATVGLSLRAFGDVRGGGDLGRLEATAYSERGADLKVRYRMGKRSEITAAYNALRQMNVGRHDQVTQRGYARYAFDPQERQLAYVRFAHRGTDSWLKHVIVTAAGQANREVRVKRRANSTTTTREEDRILTPSLSAVAGIQLTEEWTATVGSEVYYDRVTSGAFDLEEAGRVTPRRGLYPASASSLSYAAFVQQRFTRGQWTILGGLRYNGFRTFFTDEQFGYTDFRPEAVVWNTGLRYQNQSAGVFELNLLSAFRAPNVNDLSSFGPFDFGIEVPVPHLDPERSLQTEFAYRTTVGRIRWRAAAFYNRLYRLIERERSTFQGSDVYEGQDVYARVNRSSATLLGGETAATYQVNAAWSAQTYLSYTYGKVEGGAMRRTPPLHGRVGTTYRPSSKYFVQADLLWATAQRRLSSGDEADHRIAEGGTDGWAIARLRAGVEWKQFSLVAFGGNLGDVAYRMHGSGMDGAGRVWGLEIGWGW